MRSRRRNSFEVAMRMGMRAWTGNGQHGIKFAGVIQSNPATVKIYLIFSSLCLLITGKSTAKPSFACASLAQIPAAEPRRNIYRAKTRDVEVFRVNPENIQTALSTRYQAYWRGSGYRFKHLYLHNLFTRSCSHDTAPIVELKL